jgi:HSP20 family molecular chaperone IbpA
MSRAPSLHSPFLLGFDDIERALDRVTRATSDGYPPYNIERLPRSEADPERLRITLAVAGFTREELDVSVEENQLIIRGRQQDDKDRQYLHRGIAARQFQRAFLLADGMQVLGADLKNGLLSVDLARPEPERVIRKIIILARD